MMAMAGALMQLAGSGMRVIGNIYGAQTAIKQSKYQQDILEYEARYLAAAQKIEEERIRRDVRKVLGMQRASTAASGFAWSGTPEELAISTEIQGDIDIALLRSAGNIERMRLTTRGHLARSEGYGMAAGLYGSAAAGGFDTLLSQAARHGWFKKKAPASSTPGGLVTSSRTQRLRWRNA
jgi:hypothetical protein